MSHRKFEHPRCGSLGFLPRKRTKNHRGRIRRFPKDDPTKPVHLTAFVGFKAGMTHIVREVNKPGSRLNKKEVVEATTVIECPKMIVVGVTGYIMTPRGLKKIRTLFAEHLSESVIRRFYKRYRGKDHVRAFKKYQKPENWKKHVEKDLPLLKRKATCIRVLAHPKMSDIRHVGKIKAPLIEIQVNGGSIDEKVQWAFSHFEKEVRISDVFNAGDFLDVIGVTKGHGYEGTTARYGVRKLPRKTHKGLRKVGCIGAWHPERVRWTIPRAGQRGYHHRTERNKRIYRVGKSAREVNDNATTESDITQKNITPMGGFPHYGCVMNDYVLIKGQCVGIRKRTLLLRPSLFPPSLTGETGNINLKFIDTSSKFGHGRFQTVDDKNKYFGKMKKTHDTKVLNRDLHKTRLAKLAEETK
jgi:large subunit ribosomal protein L3e